MDLAEIARRSGVCPQRLRYVIDRGTVPIDGSIGQGRGNARDLPPEVAFATVVAAKLIDAGVRKPFVRGFIRTWLEASNPARSGSKKPYTAAAERGLILEIGDEHYVRTRTTWQGQPERWRKFPELVLAAPGFEPVVRISVDFGAIARQLGR